VVSLLDALISCYYQHLQSKIACQVSFRSGNIFKRTLIEHLTMTGQMKKKCTESKRLKKSHSLCLRRFLTSQEKCRFSYMLMDSSSKMLFLIWKTKENQIQMWILRLKTRMTIR
jgi:hypothetical protein